MFAERDFHRVLVSEVASRAGVGKGTVYLYFPTKDRLHRVALEASLERVAGEVERAAEADAPAEAVLREIVVSILRFFWRRPHLLTLVVRYEQRHTRSAGERRRRVMRAVERVLVRHRIGGNGNRHLAFHLARHLGLRVGGEGAHHGHRALDRPHGDVGDRHRDRVGLAGCARRLGRRAPAAAGGRSEEERERRELPHAAAPRCRRVAAGAPMPWR